jgi:uncharacterized protein YkwD
MSKASKILILSVISLVVLTLVTFGYFLFFNKSAIKTLPNIKLPSLTQVGTVSSPGGLLGPEQTSKANQLSADKIIEITNEYRKENNLPELKKNNLLTEAAEQRTEDMFNKQYFAHDSPEGVKPSDVVLKTNYNYSLTGENIALGDFKTEKDLVDAWMASPGHRANILNTEYTEIGVDATLDNYQGRATWISTQEFGKQAPTCSAPDQKISKNIDDAKARYNELERQMNGLSKEAQDLIERANQKIAQGNSIYDQTHSKTKAEPYWNDGESLGEEAQSKFNEAKIIDKQLKDLYIQIDRLVNEFNNQVNIYNKCVNS